jgi:hypothetical protein
MNAKAPGLVDAFKRAVDDAVEMAHEADAAPVAFDGKLVATVMARAALAGWRMTPLGDNRYFLARLDQGVDLDLTEVEAFLQRVGR